MVIGWLAMFIFAFHACTHMVGAGDTWVAMACGRHFVHHGVDTVEPFSANTHEAGPTDAEVATWPKWAQDITKAVGLDTVRYWHPTGWINQNWLTHVIFYRLTTMLGSEAEPYFDALIIWKFAIYFLAVVCLYATCRVLEINRLLAVVFVCLAMFIGRSFLDVRPAGFSNLLTVVFLLILALASYRNARYIWLIVPVVVFWSNVHGGYLYAFIALVPFVGWHTIMRLPKRWTVAVYCILTWAFLTVMANQFLHHEYLESVPLPKDWVFALLVAAVAASIALTACRRIGDSGVIAFHASASAILFLLLLTRFFPAPPNLNRYGQEIFARYVASSRLAFLGIFSFALALGIVVAALKGQVARVMEWKGVLHTIGAGAAAFVAMVVFNPFHLTNLTHTYIISLSKHAERWRDVHEWHRAFDWTNPVGTAIPFMVMYIFAWLCLIVWTLSLVCTVRLARPPARKQAPAGDFTWPKMDLALLVIAAMTIYMAIRSRRFIPIAGYAACPILALLIQHFVMYLATLTSVRRRGAPLGARLDPTVLRALVLGLGGALLVLAIWRFLLWQWLFLPVPGHPTLVQPRFWLAAMGTVLAFSAFPLLAVFALADGRSGEKTSDETSGWYAFMRPACGTTLLLLAGTVFGYGLWVGLKFKRVYLDYWPTDRVFTSVFMRMTASEAKPFYACQFIRDNKLSGNMFNYWTEGGFIAWGQTPDPNTGKTPLQLFMDGRAQAAYDTRVFDLWTTIMAGGPVPERVAQMRQSLTGRDYVQIGEWITEELGKYDVWAVLMPSNQFYKPFVIGLDYSIAWRVVFINNKQRLYVNIRTEKGKQLFDGMFTGATVYPDEYSANFAIGRNLLLFRDPEQKKQGLEMVIKAFQAEPSTGPMADLINMAAQSPESRPRVDEVCRLYIKDFDQNSKRYARSDGYNLRLEAARGALVQLERTARAQGNIEEADTLANRMTLCENEMKKVADTKRW
jgi:nitroreductase